MHSFDDNNLTELEKIKKKIFKSGLKYINGKMKLSRKEKL